jgi:hypothetical protein
MMAQAALCIFGVGITDTQREVESAPGVFREYVELTFRSGAVALPLFVGNRIKSKANIILMILGAYARSY